MPSDSRPTQTQKANSIPAYGETENEQHWFPMRIAYDQDVKKVATELRRQKVKFYLPTEDEIVPRKNGPKVVKRPKLIDLIFVYSTKSILTELKHTPTLCRYLRFITFIPCGHTKSQMTPMERSAVNRIVVIPDEEMKSFIKIIKKTKDKVAIIPYSETFNHIGRKVRILQGPLAGTIGTLRRIKNNKHVHIDCGGIVTVELGYMPKELYELMSN